MKLKISSVVLGLVLAVVVLYAYKVWTTPTVRVVVKKEGFADQSVGSILGSVMAGILGVGLLLGFISIIVKGPDSLSN